MGFDPKGIYLDRSQQSRVVLQSSQVRLLLAMLGACVVVHNAVLRPTHLLNMLDTHDLCVTLQKPSPLAQIAASER